jgi:hypothetical protein
MKTYPLVQWKLHWANTLAVVLAPPSNLNEAPHSGSRHWLGGMADWGLGFQSRHGMDQQR